YSILDIIKEIRKVSDFRFLYQVDELQKCGKRDLKVENAELDEVMRHLLTGTGLTWRLEDGVVLIKADKRDGELAVPQNVKLVKGVVVDSQGVGLPGVTVRLKGTALGVVTNADGTFKFQFPEQGNVVLLFSFVGMKSKEVEYRDESDLKVVLEEDVTKMEEVVVTGIFSKSKETYTGAVSVVTEKELKSFGNRNVLTTLRNIDPSFNILVNNEWGSNPNKLPEIEIRGAASIPDIDQLQSETKADLNTPLIIMDGFEITLQRMMDLDDNEIQSITLLKDASATAIYGSRGANGVIVIETKEPEAGKLRFTYTGSLNVEVPDLSDYHLLDAREKLDLEYRSGYYDNARAEKDILLKQKYNRILQDVVRGVNTYWLSKPLRTGIGHRHNLKIEGGDKSFRYSATLQYNHIAGVMKESNRNNFNGGINLSYKHEKLIFRNSLSIALNKAEESPYGTFDQYVKLNPYWTEKDENGNMKKFLDEDYDYWGSDNPSNPLYNATLDTREASDYINITNNLSIEWRPVNDLIVRGKFGIYAQTDNNDKFLPPEHTDFADYTGNEYFLKGSYAFGTGKTYRYNASLTANYSKILAEKHMLYAGVNWEMEEGKRYGYNFIVQGFPSGSLDFLGVAMQYEKDGKPSGSESTSRRLGVVGNLNYSFQDRYFVDGSYRIDGSSLYGSDRKFAGFWSAGIGWNIHREDFMAAVSFIDRLELRGSVGETGSNNFSSYESLATYKYVLNDRYYQWMGAQMAALANPALEWQKTMKYDVGLEVNLFRNRLNVIGDIYLEKTSGLMSSLELPPSNGFPSYKANIGELENRGFELKATAFVVRNTEKRVIWSVTGALVYNRDKILKLSKAMREANEKLQQTSGSVPNQIWKEGDPMNAIYVVPSLGIDPSTGKELFLKKNGEVSYTWDANARVM
ncbi:MAG: SusC/RagA family TonB-linked outer membrane protein, partial [Odoribacter sp.]|nr:SusC/RagA family TonB-linked outer membrane protein [Odoribacter sp.]